MAKQKIGIFSESDAKKIARVVNSIARNGTSNYPRPRKRISSSVATLIPVTVTQVGGANGTATTAPTWTYDVTYQGDVILSAVSPEWARVHGSHAAATKGTARYDSVTAEWKLFQIDEVPTLDVFECEE